MTLFLSSIVATLFLGMVVAQAPSEWTCEPSYNYWCDCNCDPDCDIQPVCYCGKGYPPQACGIYIGRRFFLIQGFWDYFLHSDQQLTGSVPSAIAKFVSLRELRLDNNHLTGRIPSEIGMMSSLEKLLLGRNPLVCDSDLLGWYPEPRVASKVTDREMVICANANLYGELGLNPHVLRVDEESPMSYATILFPEVTSRNITIDWAYEYDEKTVSISNVLNVSFVADFDTYGLYYNGTHEYGKFRSCLEFKKPEDDRADDKLFFGFEISWGIGLRTCYLANEVVLNKDLFSYTIANLVPSTEYDIRIRPFHVYFIENEEISRVVFGISSTTKTIKTDGGTPVDSPGNVKLETVNARDLLIAWDEIDQEGVTGYEVQVFTGIDTLQETSPSERTSVPISNLEPESVYHCSVRAKTGSDNWGPWSPSVTVKTCPENMRRTLKSGEDCFALVGYYRLGRQAKSCSSENISESLVENSCLENGITVETLPIKTGYWRDSLKTDDIKKCRKPQFCDKISSMYNVTGPNSQCAMNHRGVYCFGCIGDYVLSSSGCEECTKQEEKLHKSRTRWFVVIMVILFMVGILKITCGAGVFEDSKCLKLLSCGNRERRRRNKIAECVKSVSVKCWKHLRGGFMFIAVKFRILMGFFQVFFSFQRTFQKGSVDTDTSLLEMITGLNPSRLADEFNIRCAYDYNHYDTLFLYTLVPIVFVIVVVGVYMFWFQSFSSLSLLVSI
uniref:Fibronectin type-III domain-containing protein n=1 Tax=Aplanochytrium stocchinoi TaxID=215587 RepID=A0A7S3LKN6_9STRA